MPATSIGPMSQVRAIQIPVDGSTASVIIPSVYVEKSGMPSLLPPLPCKYAPANVAAAPLAATNPAMSSEAQIEGARFCRSLAIMLLANPALANTSP